MAKLSYSALDTFRTCPLKYKYQHIDKLPQRPSGVMHFGSALHQVMEELYAHQMVPLSLAELQDIFTKRFHAEFYPDAYTADNDFQAGLKIVEREYHKHAADQGNTIARERSFVLPLSAEYQMSGRIDRIDKIGDDTLEIIDYKTSSTVRSVAEVSQNLQLAIYYLALQQLWPEIKQVHLSLQYLRADMKVSFVATAELAAKAKQDLALLLAQLAASGYEPQPGGHCDFCDYRDRCPMTKHRYLQDTNQVSEPVVEGKTLADRYIGLLAQKKQLDVEIDLAKQDLNQYLDTNDFQKLYGTLGSVKRSITESQRLRSKDAQAYLAAQGVLAEFMQPSTTTRFVVSSQAVAELTSDEVL